MEKIKMSNLLLVEYRIQITELVRRSVTSYSVFLEGAPITVKSGMQKTVALSVTEAETNAGLSCAQEMML